MNAALVGVIFTTFAAAMSFLISPTIFPGAKIRIAAGWVIAAACAFFIENNLTALMMAGAALVVLAPLDNVKRTLLYIAVFPALPEFYNADIPFPGLNYLINIDFGQVATLVLLGPVFVSAMMAPTAPILRTVDRLLLIYVLVTGVMTIRDLPFTSMMRATFEQFVLIFMPYVAVSRALQTQKDVENALKALFAGIVVLAFVGLISSLKSWNYYAHIADAINFKVYTGYRNGLLRIGGTVVPTLLAYLMGIGVAVAAWLRSERAQPVYFLYGFLVLFGFVAFATGARGGWVAGALAVGFYFLLPRLNRMTRRLMLGSVAAAVIGGLVLIVQGSDVISDEYGTFDYRAELIRTSFEQIADRPLFGAPDFRESPRFAHLVQGEGIVDVVNGYLQVALSYGLFGLIFYVSANALALRRCLAALDEPAPRRAADERRDSIRTLSLLVAAHVGLLAMLATISAVSYIWHYNYLVLGLMVAQARIHAALSGASADEAQSESAPPPEALPAGAARPYGARFVRRI